MSSKKLVLCTMLFFVSGFLFGENFLFKLSDLKGIDSSKMIDEYSVFNQIQPEEHEIISLSAKSQGAATIFEVTFATPVEVPDDRIISQSGATLKSYASSGFYTFNLDIYIDTDQITGSGKTNSLPGRNAQISPELAWEKVICLSPQPNYARLILQQEMKSSVLKKVFEQKGRVSPEDLRDVEKQLNSTIENEIYFPTLIRVHGATIEFSVPDSFFNGKAKPDWRYSAAVSNSNLLEIVTNSGKLPATTSSYEFKPAEQYALSDR